MSFGPKYLSGEAVDEILATGHMVCISCGRDLSLERFDDRPETRLGKFRKCRDCRQETFMANLRGDPERYEVHLAKHKDYHDSHKDEERAQKLRYFSNPLNRIRQREQLRQHYLNNKDRYTAYWRRRMEREANAPGKFTDDDLQRIYRDQDGRCVYCGADLSDGYQTDHIVPLIRGGSNDPSNIQLTCARCNRTKGAKTHDEYLKYLSLGVNEYA